MSLLERLKSEIISKLCAKNVNLVRFHDKNFNKTGDLSFPCLGNKKVWGDSDLCDKNLEELLNEMETIRILKILLITHQTYPIFLGSPNGKKPCQ